MVAKQDVGAVHVDGIVGYDDMGVLNSVELSQKEVSREVSREVFLEVIQGQETIQLQFLGKPRE